MLLRNPGPFPNGWVTECRDLIIIQQCVMFEVRCELRRQATAADAALWRECARACNLTEP